MPKIARKKIVEQVDPEEQLGAVKSAILKSTAAWFEAFGTIQAKGGELLQFPVLQANWLQRKISEVISYCELVKRPCRILLLKPRQKGCSTFSMAAFYRFLAKKRRRGGVIGGSHTQGSNLFKMLRCYADNDHFASDQKARVLEEKATFPNGSTAMQETASNPNAGRSGTYECLVATEVARWAEEGVSNAADVLAGILKCIPMLPGTLGILETTAAGACYDDQTELLTDQGWKFFKELDGTESILTKNPTTDIAYYQKEWKPQVFNWDGEMVQFQSRNVKLLVTPNHQMWMARQKGPMKFSRADSTRGKSTDYYFDRAFTWHGPDMGNITIPSYTHPQGNGYRTCLPVVVPIDIWLEFLGHFLSEGNVRWKPGVKQVVVTQTVFPELFRKSVSRLAEVLGVSVREEAHGRGRRFSIINAQLASYLKDYTQPKRIPREVLLGVSQAQAKSLLKAFYDGDGCQNRQAATQNIQGRCYPGCDKTLEDDLQELILKCGYSTNAYGPPNNRKVIYSDRRRATIRHSNSPAFTHYSGKVYCVSLPKDHLLLVRRQRSVVWCGNSGDFYERWQRGISFEDFQKGEDGWVKIFAPWFVFEDSTRDPKLEGLNSVADYSEKESELVRQYDLGLSQISWMRWACREECKGDMDVFNQDYPTDDVSAFLTSGRRVFNIAALNRMKEESKLPENQPAYGVLELSEDEMRVSFRPTIPNDCRWLIWEKPRSGCEYMFGVDLMTGATQAGGKFPDNHGPVIWRKGYFQKNKGWVPSRVVAHMIGDWAEWEKNKRFELIWDIDVLEEQVFRGSKWYGDCMIAPEINMDRGIIELLKQRGANLYQREIFNRREFTEDKAVGWLTDHKTREMIIEKWKTAIREHGRSFEGVDVHSPMLLAELESMVVKQNGRSEAKSGKKDDLCLGGGIGLVLLEKATTYRIPERDRLLPPDLQQYLDAQPDTGSANQYS